MTTSERTAIAIDSDDSSAPSDARMGEPAQSFSANCGERYQKNPYFSNLRQTAVSAHANSESPFLKPNNGKLSAYSNSTRHISLPESEVGRHDTPRSSCLPSISLDKLSSKDEGSQLGLRYSALAISFSNRSVAETNLSSSSATTVRDDDFLHDSSFFGDFREHKTGTPKTDTKPYDSPIKRVLAARSEAFVTLQQRGAPVNWNQHGRGLSLSAQIQGTSRLHRNSLLK